MKPEKILIVIPAYNASATIVPLLAETFQYASRSSTIVIDDGSTDMTGELSRAAGAVVVSHKKNSGKGAALRTGFHYAIGQTCDAVITMDADGQHAPSKIPEIVSLFRSGRADIVIGNRLHDMNTMPVHRKASNIVTTALIRIRTGREVYDSQSGFRLIRREILERFSTYANGFAAETELLIRASLKGYRIGQVPIPTLYNSSASHMRNWETTINFIHLLLKEY